MRKSKRRGVDPLANAIANNVQIGVAYERMREASEFGLPEGLTLPGYEDADPPLGRYHGQRGRELLSRPQDSAT
jgi:hypothetical protein